VKKLFISKYREELGLLPSFCNENHIELVATPFIRFEPVTFSVDSDFEVVFFGSIRAASFFLLNQDIPKHVHLACVGETTAKKLRDKGYNVSFTGLKSGQPELVANEFLKWLGSRRVLIPCSQQSKRTISKVIPSNQKEEKVVYQTLTDCRPLDDCDCYIFTSPSNVESFLSCNSKPEGKIIAWGTTTQKAMIESKLFADYTLEQSTEEELIRLLKSEL
jgi:uroporphyrinogen-III synthase